MSSLAAITTNKLTRKGRLLRAQRECYLRDDIPCHHPSCEMCGPSTQAAASDDITVGKSAGPATGASGEDAVRSFSSHLSSEPRGRRFLMPDASAVLSQIDLMECAPTLFTDVVIAASVLAAVKRRSVKVYARLRTLLSDASRRTVAFANDHHSEVHVPRQPGQSTDQHERALMARAAAWLHEHYAAFGAGIIAVSEEASLLSAAIAADVAARGSGFSGESGVLVLTAAQLVQHAEAADESLRWLNLSEMVAAPLTSAAADDASSASGADAAGSGSSTSSAGGRARLLYRPHLPSSAVATGLRARTLFQGTLRVNRDNVTEARVAVHGISGKGDASGRGGGDDMAALLVQGWRHMNRAVDGDVVIVQLLPKRRWKQPSKKLLDSGEAALQAEAAAEAAKARGRKAADAAASGAGAGASSAAADAEFDSDSDYDPVLDVDSEDDDEDEGSGKGKEVASASAGVVDAAAAAAAAAAKAAKAAEKAAAKAARQAARAGRRATVDDLRESMRSLAAARAKALAAGQSRAAAMASYTEPLPTARVVAIARRNWRQYCGSIEPLKADAPAAALAAASAAGDEEASAAAGAEDSSAGTGSGGAGAGDAVAAAERVLFMPVDPKVPPIVIQTRQKDFLANKRIAVAIDCWSASERYPRGHYVRALGDIGHRKTETEVLLAEHDIAWMPFSPDVIACLPPNDWSITPENSVGRTDLRHICVCSIDPPGCKDIDDALHARWLPNGHVEVGVHIADVTYFVRPGTAIDEEAARRANTTYLVDRRLDMLPQLLTETLCSLQGKQDRFAFSCTWEFKPAGSTAAVVAAARAAAAGGAAGAGSAAADGGFEAGLPPVPITSTSTSAPGLLGGDDWELVPGSIRFFKSIIHSRAAMTYEKAQGCLDSDAPEAASDPVIQGVKLLASIARALKAQRKAAGALTLASAETKFTLDNENADPVSVGAYELRETNSTVEEWMLAANVAVAARITEAYPRYALLRRHPSPPDRSFDPLRAAAHAVGAEVDASSSKALADSLDRIAAANPPFVGRLLRILATRCMMQAAYFCSGELPASERHHYGLAAPIYTHFTSPIRRYADVVVHRLLAAALDVEPLPASYEDKTLMKKLSDNMNRRHLNSQMAGRASSGLHTSIFFDQRVVVQAAVVMKVGSNGIVVFVPKLGLEGSISLKHPATGAALTFDEEQQLLTTAPPAENTAALKTLSYAPAADSKGKDKGKDKGKAKAAPAAAVATGGAAAAASSSATSAAAASDSAAASAGELTVRLFDEVTVAISMEVKARGRKELRFRLISPAFHTMPTPAPAPAPSSEHADGGAAAGGSSSAGTGVKRSRAAAADDDAAATAGAGAAAASSDADVGPAAKAQAATGEDGAPKKGRGRGGAAGGKKSVYAATEKALGE